MRRRTISAVFTFGILTFVLSINAKAQLAPSSSTADYEVKIAKGELFVRQKGTTDWRSSEKITEPIVVGALDESHKIYVVTKAIKGPTAIHMESPNYPSDAPKSAQRSQVSLVAVVDDYGAVRDPVIESSPGPEFSKAALEAMKKWSFKPAKLNRVPVAVLIKVILEF